jgi:hypothetical protein
VGAGAAAHPREEEAEAAVPHQPAAVLPVQARPRQAAVLPAQAQGQALRRAAEPRRQAERRAAERRAAALPARARLARWALPARHFATSRA